MTKEAMVKKSQSQELVPAFLQEAIKEGNLGLENADRKDMILPRLGLCQSMTPQRKRSEPGYIEGLEEGMFFNTVTGVIYGTKVTVVPLLFFKTRFRFKPMEEGGGTLCQSQDFIHGIGDPGGICLKCPMQLWQDNKKPACTEYFNYAVLVMPPNGAALGLDALAVLSLKSTGVKEAKSWNMKMKMRSIGGKQVPIFAGLYELTSAEAKNKSSQSWHQCVVKNKDLIEDEATYRLAREFYESVKAMQQAGTLSVEGTDGTDHVDEGEVVEPASSEI